MSKVFCEVHVQATIHLGEISLEEFVEQSEVLIYSKTRKGEVYSHQLKSYKNLPYSDTSSWKTKFLFVFDVAGEVTGDLGKWLQKLKVEFKNTPDDVKPKAIKVLSFELQDSK